MKTKRRTPMLICRFCGMSKHGLDGLWCCEEWFCSMECWHTHDVGTEGFHQWPGLMSS